MIEGVVLDNCLHMTGTRYHTLCGNSLTLPATFHSEAKPLTFFRRIKNLDMVRCTRCAKLHENLLLNTQELKMRIVEEEYVYEEYEIGSGD